MYIMHTVHTSHGGIVNDRYYTSLLYMQKYAQGGGEEEEDVNPLNLDLPVRLRVRFFCVLENTLRGMRLRLPMVLLKRSQCDRRASIYLSISRCVVLPECLPLFSVTIILFIDLNAHRVFPY